ncbi:c-type cytochrome biogenesis protein CcmI [Hoeflea sp.]|uniref:c-type cytochrome biogenesis protein CcmI n=1 Tax=Hoeflea sp. TaxID=1940281 RepID=UPI003A93AED6
MLFWVIAAVMTAVATLVLLGPLARARSQSADVPELHDVEVYRDQLAEVDRDLAGGLVEPTQAEVARTEISRRLLTAARKSDAAEAGVGSHNNRGLRRAAIVLVALFMPLAALTVYLEIGRPDLPQLPLAARLQADPENVDIAMLVSRAEQHLAGNPDDGRGWEVLGPIYLRTGQFPESVAAFRKAVALLGPSAGRLSNLGEALYSEAGGVVTEEAGLAFQTARELDPSDPKPQFFLALALSQSGKREAALSAFSVMAENAPVDAPWLPAVRTRIAELQADSGPAPGPLSGAGSMPRGPSAADIAAAQDMSPEDRQAMIGTMIAGLEARLAENPDNIEGWLRLVRSLVVSGERNRAQTALDRAFAVFATPGTDNQRLVTIAEELDLGATATLGGVPMAPPRPALQSAPSKPAAALGTPFILPEANPGTANAATQAVGPSEADIAAADSIPAEDRMAMIRGMVESLDAKLSENPDNMEGWLRLVRSYAVLGDPGAAGAALRKASVTFPGDSEGGRALAELAAELGLNVGMDSQ